MTYPMLLNSDAWTSKSLAFNLTGESDNIIHTILGFHRFVELFIKDLLRRINPYLAVKIPDQGNELFRYLDNVLPAEQINTVEYRDAINRLRRSFEYFPSDTPQYSEVLKVHEFMITKENSRTLDVLAQWRNRIMHNGSTFPNLIAFEYLISQGVIPIISELLASETLILKGWYPPFLKTQTGIDILAEILNTKILLNDFERQEKHRESALLLLKIGHLKELGRSSFFFEENSFYHETAGEDFKSMTERLVESELQKGTNVIDRKTCVCCGLATLVIYSKTVNSPWRTEPHRIFWCKCLACDYSLRGDIVGDPFQFGLGAQKIFDF